ERQRPFCAFQERLVTRELASAKIIHAGAIAVGVAHVAPSMANDMRQVQGGSAERALPLVKVLPAPLPAGVGAQRNVPAHEASREHIETNRFPLVFVALHPASPHAPP